MDSLGQQLSALQVLLALLALALGSVIVVYTLISGGSVPREGTETTGQLGARRKVVLAIAHPDDECMFFGPTLTTCKDAEWTVLCFSTGNADGYGGIRSVELEKSCAALSIPSSRVHIFNEPELQDGMRQQWPASSIASLLTRFHARHPFDTIVTFDDHGVSGHPNHIAVYRGVALFLSTHRPSSVSPPPASLSIVGYKLASVSLLRKYIGPMDALISALKRERHGATAHAALAVSSRQPSLPSSILLVAAPAQAALTRAAMRCHASQYVWFRRLFVWFSRFIYVNELVPIGRA